MKTAISISDLEPIIQKHQAYGAKHTRYFIGEEVLKHIKKVQLLGQIETAEGEQTYLYLRDWLRSHSESERNDWFKQAEDYLEFRQAAVLALFCVWTVIFNRDTDYWRFFSEQLAIKNNSARHWQASQALKNIIDRFPQLATFPEVAKDTPHTRIYRIYLHALPPDSVKKFIRDYLFNPDDQGLDIKTQRERWVQKMLKHNKFKKDLLPFFKSGGRAARAYTRWFMEMRETYNYKGSPPENHTLPQYILTGCEAVLRDNKTLLNPQQTAKYVGRIVRSADPELMFNPQRFLSPFLKVPLGPVEDPGACFLLKTSDEQVRFYPQIVEQDGQWLARESTPERYPELKVAPAKNYNLTLNPHQYEIEGVGEAPYLVFDARTGQRLDLTEDAPWPRQFYVLVKELGVYDEQGHEVTLAALQSPWHDWFYATLEEVNQFELRDGQSSPLILKGRSQTQPLNLELHSPHTFPNWVHTAEEVLPLSTWEALNISISGAQRDACLQVEDLLRSKPVFTHFFREQNTWAPSPENMPTLPGVYLFRLDSGIDEVEHKVLYLPHAVFERDFETTGDPTELAKALHLSLPICPELDDLHRPDSFESLSQSVHMTIKPERAAVRLTFFQDTLHSVFVHLMCRDIRWRQYGYAQMPLLHEMHNHTGFFPLRAMEDTEESYVRIEIEPDVMQYVKSTDRGIGLQMRQLDGAVLFEHSQKLQRRQAFFCDIDLLQLAKEAETYQVNHTELGIVWNQKFFSLIRFGLALELEGLSQKPGEMTKVNQDLVQQIELLWNPQPHDPEDLILCVGSFDGQHSFDIEVSSAQGQVCVELPLKLYDLDWGVQIFDGNEFFPSFNANQAQLTWTQQGIQTHINQLCDNHQIRVESIGFRVKKERLQECLQLHFPQEFSFLSRLPWQLKGGDHFRETDYGLITHRNWQGASSEESLRLTLAPQGITLSIPYQALQPEELFSEPRVLENNAHAEVLCFDIKPHFVLPKVLYWRYWPEAYPESWESVSASVQDNRIEFVLPPVLKESSWQGQIQIIPSHTPGQSDSQVYRWNRSFTLQGSSLAAVRPLSLRLITEINPLKALADEDLVSDDREPSPWALFLQACEQIQEGQESKLIELLGWPAFEEISPFGKRRIWELRGQAGIGRGSRYHKLATFQTHTDPAELLDEELLRHYPSSAWHQLHMQGISRLELSCCKTHKRFDCSLVGSALNPGFQLIPSRQEAIAKDDMAQCSEPYLRLFAHFPKHIWLHPEKWVPQILLPHDTLAQVEQALWNDEYTYLVRRWIDAFDYLDFYNGKFLSYWWKYRKQNGLNLTGSQDKFPQLNFLLGAYTATCRMWAHCYQGTTPRSVNAPIHENHIEKMRDLLEYTHDMLHDYLERAQQPQAFLFMLAQDAMMAELIMRWYYDKDIWFTKKHHQHTVHYFKKEAIYAYAKY